jgi:hypothetical protein
LISGVAVADQVLALIDKDCDGRISNAEGTAYAQRVLKDLELRLDEKVLDLGSMNVVFPSLQDVKNGLGVIRIKASAALGQLAAGRHKLKLTNTHLPTISVYLVNALVPQDPAIKLARQTRDELQRDYRLEFSMGTSSP